MFRTRTLSLAALMFVATATLAQAQIPGSFAPTPTANITLLAQKAESFAMTLSSTVQASALAIADSTAGAIQHRWRELRQLAARGERQRRLGKRQRFVEPLQQHR
jgi:hypothetical protein